MKYNVYEIEYESEFGGFRGYYCGDLIDEGLQFETMKDLYEYAERLEKRYNLSRIAFSEYDEDDEGIPEPEYDEDKDLFKVRRDKNGEFHIVDV